jgi:hypothetical protein
MDFARQNDLPLERLLAGQRLLQMNMGEEEVTLAESEEDTVQGEEEMSPELLHVALQDSDTACQAERNVESKKRAAEVAVESKKRAAEVAVESNKRASLGESWECPEQRLSKKTLAGAYLCDYKRFPSVLTGISCPQTCSSPFLRDTPLKRQNTIAASLKPKPLLLW